ncbi:hypothetical protein K438DRAFT_1956306 [Mycena galopus ATCC 62051]|nr:hypothetical protein K438DRAFT_1956306 [Mycena galopus ATCC 62051]
MSSQRVPGTDTSQEPPAVAPRQPRPEWMASWTPEELQQWHNRISGPISADRRAAHQVPDVPLPPGSVTNGESVERVWSWPSFQRGERLQTETLHLALSLSALARASTSDSDAEASDDEDIFASDGEDGFRDSRPLTMDDLYIGGARPAE